ncbi:MAG: hypothetical protein IKW51_08795 [Bacteroidales bacterium]|nr:hypothetical protein [Bacteroidales bacterium]
MQAYYINYMMDNYEEENIIIDELTLEAAEANKNELNAEDYIYLGEFKNHEEALQKALQDEAHAQMERMHP